MDCCDYVHRYPYHHRHHQQPPPPLPQPTAPLAPPPHLPPQLQPPFNHQYYHPYYRPYDQRHLQPEPTYYYDGSYYADYYGVPYYQPHTDWSSMQDYVYSPKEARLRKAMRQLAPPLDRWAARRNDGMQLQPSMMGMDDSLCNYPTTSTENGQFSSGMNGYGNGEKIDSTGNYIQQTPNPLAQLQQHAEMWPVDYCTTLKTRSHARNRPTPTLDAYPITESYGLADVATYNDVRTSSNENAPPAIASLATPTIATNETKDTEKVRRLSGKTLPDFNEAFGATERGRLSFGSKYRIEPLQYDGTGRYDDFGP